MEIILILFAIAAIIQIFFYVFFFSHLIFYKNKKILSEEKLPVSVIICAKNEATNLRKNLPFILEQDYPSYEVIVVNDNSEDDTSGILSEFKIKYPELQIVNISSETRWLKGKRFALALGIKSAKYDLLLLTDADCYPDSNQWINMMQRNFNGKKEIVLGYSPYEKMNGMLNKIIRYDAFFAALQYISFALSGLPYMGVGRNLAYKKELFYRNKGFSPDQKHLLSGDDDLFINKAANSKNTIIELDEKSFMLSAPKKKWAHWVYQKNRHLGTGIYYRMKHQILLGLLSLSHFLFYATLFILLLWKENYLIIIYVFMTKLIIQWCILYKPMKRLQVSELWILFPLLDFIYFFIYLIFAPAIFFKPKNKWK